MGFYCVFVVIAVADALLEPTVDPFLAELSVAVYPLTLDLGCPMRLALAAAVAIYFKLLPAGMDYNISLVMMEFFPSMTLVTLALPPSV